MILSPLERNREEFWGIPCNETDLELAQQGVTLSSCPTNPDESDRNFGEQIGVPFFCKIGPGGGELVVPKALSL